MSKYNLIFGFSLLILMASCGEKTDGVTTDGKPDKESLKSDIQQLDDSLKIYYTALMNGETSKVPSSTIQLTIDAHMRYFHHYPEDEYAAECLDKVHQLYMQEKSYVKSVQACDTLISRFPDYKNLHEVLLSAGTTYDYMLDDKENARKYYELVVKHPKVDQETKKSIAFRLKNLDKSLEEMAKIQ